MMTQIFINEYITLDNKAVEIISKSIKEIGKEKKYVVIGICGGRSVSGIFQKLKLSKINWSNVHIFLVDERMVHINDDESNYKLAYKEFIHHLLTHPEYNLNKHNVHPFFVEKGIEAYESELKQFGGVYDIVLLSSGEDGHIAALYPNHHSIEDKSEFFIQMDDSPKMPPKRMTISRKLLSQSKVALLILKGEGKRQALDNYNNKALQLKDCPAKIIDEINESYLLTNLK